MEVKIPETVVSLVAGHRSGMIAICDTVERVYTRIWEGG